MDDAKQIDHDADDIDVTHLLFDLKDLLSKNLQNLVLGKTVTVIS